jgi:hypothetical protein
VKELTEKNTILQQKFSAQVSEHGDIEIERAKTNALTLDLINANSSLAEKSLSASELDSKLTENEGYLAATKKDLTGRPYAFLSS